MNEPLHFKTRNEFRIWLMNHCMSGGGVWLKFEKSKNTAFKAGDALEEAKYVEGLIHERFPTIKETLINYTGPVIGAHSGPGTVNIHYVGKQRVDIKFK